MFVAIWLPTVLVKKMDKHLGKKIKTDFLPNSLLFLHDLNQNCVKARYKVSGKRSHKPKCTRSRPVSGKYREQLREKLETSSGTNIHWIAWLMNWSRAMFTLFDLPAFPVRPSKHQKWWSQSNPIHQFWVSKFGTLPETTAQQQTDFCSTHRSVSICGALVYQCTNKTFQRRGW